MASVEPGVLADILHAYGTAQYYDFELLTVGSRPGGERHGGRERRAGRGDKRRPPGGSLNRSPFHVACPFRQASVDYLKANAKRFSADELAKMLWGFGQCGYQDEALVSLMHDIAEMLQGGNCNR